MAKVSIIITCYNLGAYLEEALASALAQTYADYEVLLVDDGSTDHATITLLDRLPAHPRLKLLRTLNRGVARARNYGIGVASGKYILPLDADDRILPDYIALAARILDQRPEVGFVGCYYRTFGEREVEHTSNGYELPGILVENVVPISSLFRRECWEQVGGYCPDLNGMEDWDLWLGILGQGYTGEVVPRILFEYRVRQHSNIGHIREPAVYQQRLQLLRERHRKLYEAHVYGVLGCQDLLFARQLGYNLWLEQQWHLWEGIAEQRLATIDALSSGSGRTARMRAWRQLQQQRWERIKSEHSSTPARFRALSSGAWRVLNRRLHQIVPQAIGRVDTTKKQ